jgi:hypothetical protein
MLTLRRSLATMQPLITRGGAVPCCTVLSLRVRGQGAGSKDGRLVHWGPSPTA